MGFLVGGHEGLHLVVLAALHPVGERLHRADGVGADLTQEHLVGETAVADHRDRARHAEIGPGVPQLDGVGAAGGADEHHVGGRALDLGDVGAEVLVAERMPDLLEDLTAGFREGGDETAAALPAEPVVRADGHGVLIALFEGPLAGREVRLAAGVPDAHDERVELALGEVVRTRDVERRDALAGDIVGHGIGRVYHEEPQVLHYGKPGAGLRLEKGMCFTVEPMINAGKAATRLMPDGWTVVTRDHSLSAQWEHTVTVTDDGFEILTPWPKAA